MQTRLPRVWIITMPEHPEGPIAPVRRALRTCPAGVVGVQLRAPGVDDRQLVAWGRELRAIASARKSMLTVSRRPDVAQIVGADGVHLPEHGLLPSSIREHWPELEVVGASQHDAAGLERAASEGASFAFLSPVFEVPGKNPSLGIRGFEAAIAGVGLPTYALGGIGAAHVEALLAAGAAGIAVRRAIYDCDDPGEALRELLDALDKNTASSE